MKTYNLKTWVGVLVLGLLTACGGDDNSGYLFNGSNLAGCAAPTGVKQGTYTANIAGAGTLQLDVYNGSSGTIYAIGALSVPNVQTLFLGSALNSGYGYGYGSTGYGGAGFGQTVGTSATSLQQCVGSNGLPGTLDGGSGTGSAYQNISNLSLVGPNGVTVQMGDATPGTSAYFSGQRIYGQVVITIPGVGPGSFTMVP